MIHAARPETRSRLLVFVLAAASLATGGLGVTPARASDAQAAPPATDAIVDALPDDAALTGDDIYERVQANRFRSYVQDTRLLSGDRAASTQETRLQATWKNLRDEKDEPTNGVYSKSRIEYTYPFDVRYTTYLIIDNADRGNDQFVYLPSRRRVRRVNLRGESVLGTDFSFEDVVPRELEHSSNLRLPDEVVQGIRCWVIEATPRPDEDSEYSRFILVVEKQHAVPLVTRYFDRAGIEIKRLEAPRESIQEFVGVFVPMRAKMTQLQTETWTELTVEKLVPNPELAEGVFDLRRLERH